jgi:hypothetical protein
MTTERAPRMPGKARLTWRIGGLRLDSSRGAWLATGFKSDRVSVIVLPHLQDASSEEAWLESIEAAFEASAWDPLGETYPAPLEGGETTTRN